MKNRGNDWDREKKIPKVVKGTDKSGKHRKSLYNMLSDYDKEDSEFDSDDGDVKISYHGNFNYSKQR